MSDKVCPLCGNLPAGEASGAADLCTCNRMPSDPFAVGPNGQTEAEVRSERYAESFGVPRLDVNSLTERVAQLVYYRLVTEDALPLPKRQFHVEVDDPDMKDRHVFRIRAGSARAAQVAGYRRAVVAEGFRVVHHHPQGDRVTAEEVTLALGPIHTRVFLVGEGDIAPVERKPATAPEAT